MTEIEQIVHKLITAVKLTPELSQVRFVKEYNNIDVETPVSSYLAIVSIDSMTREKNFLGNTVHDGLKGDKYSATIKVSIYAPDYENGSSLTGISGVFCESIKNVDEENVIEKITFEPIAFDSNINAMYRSCKVYIGFYLCEEAVV